MSAPLSGWWRRVGAALLDGLVLALPSLVLIGVLIGAGTNPTVAAVLTALVVGLYAPLLMSRSGEHNGQTLGKQALNIKVVAPDGPLQFGRAFVREYVGKALLSYIPFWVLVDDLWPLWDKGNQALHDKMVETHVVHLLAAPAAERPRYAAPAPAARYVAVGAGVGARGAPPPPPPPPSRDADWYPDPMGEARLRYWDGDGWTEHIAA